MLLNSIRFYDNEENFIISNILNKISLILKKKNYCTICISGGTTFQKLLKLLAKEEIDIHKVIFFLTDERIVKISSEFSNFNTINSCTEKKFNILPMYNGVDIKKSILTYKKYLINYLDGRYTFDILLLGMGEDGHIASLFENEKLYSKDIFDILFIEKKINGFSRLSLNLDLLKKSKFTFLTTYGKKKYDVVVSQNKNLPIHKFLENNTVSWYYNFD